MPKPQGFHLAMQTLIPTPSGCQGYKRLMEMLLRDHHLWSNPFILQVLIPTIHWEGKGLTRDPLACSCWPRPPEQKPHLSHWWPTSKSGSCHQERFSTFTPGQLPTGHGTTQKSASESWTLPSWLHVPYVALGPLICDWSKLRCQEAWQSHTGARILSTQVRKENLSFVVVWGWQIEMIFWINGAKQNVLLDNFTCYILCFCTA